MNTTQSSSDHDEALLDNQPCELCGQIEMDLRHRGIGHTHVPGGDIPAHVAGVLAQLYSWHGRPDDVIVGEHDAALIEYRQVLAGRRLATFVADES